MAQTGPTERRRRDQEFRDVGVAAAASIFQGALVALQGGYAVKGQEATDLTAIGIAEVSVDNSAGQDGDKTIRVRKGCFRFASAGAGDQLSAADIGADVYIVDDDTVGKTDGGAARSVAGKLFDFDGTFAWVLVG